MAVSMNLVFIRQIPTRKASPVITIPVNIKEAIETSCEGFTFIA